MPRCCSDSKISQPPVVSTGHVPDATQQQPNTRIRTNMLVPLPSVQPPPRQPSLFSHVTCTDTRILIALFRTPPALSHRRRCHCHLETMASIPDSAAERPHFKRPAADAMAPDAPEGSPAMHLRAPLRRAPLRRAKRRRTVVPAAALAAGSSGRPQQGEKGRPGPADRGARGRQRPAVERERDAPQAPRTAGHAPASGRRPQQARARPAGLCVRASLHALAPRFARSDLPPDAAGVLGTFAVTVPSGTIRIVGGTFTGLRGLA